MDEEKSATVPPANGARLAKLIAPGALWPTAAILAGLLYFGLDYLITALTHESTDDAFIAAHVVSIAPRVAGEVAAVHVLDNQMVHSNDPLMEIDPADYTTSVTQKQSSADAAAANYQSMLAALNLMSEKVTTAQATADQSKADAEAAQATDTRAQADFQRYTELRKQNTISAQEFDAAQAAVKQGDANLTAAKQKAIADASKINESRAELSATEAAVAMALAQMRQAEANVQAAHLDLSYTKIHAPCDGRVTRKAVEPGDYVQIGQQLMSLVPTDVWVIANFKESQLQKMRPGQRVSVEIDALGGRMFQAHVDSVQAGSGAAFSLLPPENATGNYVKVVQRVPVKIFFDEPLPAGHTFGPGLSVTPSVQVSRFEIPAWAIALLAVVLATAAAFVFRLVLNRRMNNASR
jgi:membrane fusion protein (multidrug efflux system)